MFKIAKVRSDGTRETLDRLGRDELDPWMRDAYGKHATVEVTQETTGKTVIYTDNGEWWEKV